MINVVFDYVEWVEGEKKESEAKKDDRKNI